MWFLFCFEMETRTLFAHRRNKQAKPISLFVSRLFLFLLCVADTKAHTITQYYTHKIVQRREQSVCMHIDTHLCVPRWLVVFAELNVAIDFNKLKRETFRISLNSTYSQEATTFSSTTTTTTCERTYTYARARSRSMRIHTDTDLLRSQ